jgi:hypothetical protein
MNNEKRLELELSIVRQIVGSALAQRYSISVHDGQGITVSYSTSEREVMAAVRSVDEDHLIFFARDGRRVGYVVLVYGNDPWEVVADHTVSDEMDAVLKDAMDRAELLESRHG